MARKLKQNIRLAIANRGEVALRIIRTCREMGITSILLHSHYDRKTTAYRSADETVELPGETAADNYLNIQVMVAAARKAKASLVHPGFGFLSENPLFPEALEDAGITFVGPSPASMRQLGDKVAAKALARRAKIPLLPYSENPQDFRKIGFPLIIKAANSGGGRAIRVVLRESEFATALEAAKREAGQSFGSIEIFIEKYLAAPKHIEIQIFGDHCGRIVCLGERECSSQRRHQKLIEESPSPSLNKRLREQICNAAKTIAKLAKYQGAGTIEFLVDNNKFYFMEANTRLQVEHTVTEMLYGVDLVRWQILTALGEALPNTDLTPRGHALQLRICAESSQRGFLPSIGTLTSVLLPPGPHRRYDFGFETSDPITPMYDSLIGKLITWAPDRNQNIARSLIALSEMEIAGVETNIEFLSMLLDSEPFRGGAITTNYIDKHFSSGVQPPPLAKKTPPVTDVTKTQPASPVPGYISPWQTRPLASGSGTTASNTSPAAAARPTPPKGFSDGKLHSPMPGKIIVTPKNVGDAIEAGETVCILEAMKMEYHLKAPFGGTLRALYKKAGDIVVVDELLAEIASGSS